MTESRDAIRAKVEHAARLAEATLRASPLGRDHDIGSLTTYRVGGRAAAFVQIESIADAATIARIVAETGCPVRVIGRGSNLLVAEAGFEGLVVRLGEAFASIDRTGPLVVVGAAALLPAVARQLAGGGRTGFEWAVGVPGSVGGAVRMNAGGHGSDMAASLRQVRIVDLSRGEESTVAAADLSLGYRRSSVSATQLVIEASMDLGRGDPDRARAEIDDIVRWRRANQPGGQNAGSVFTNPPGDSAGRLIDAAGLKGFRVGTAAVSTKHANFIQADPGGSADDIVRLMVVIADTVEERQGVRLHAETELVGVDTAIVDALQTREGP